MNPRVLRICLALALLPAAAMASADVTPPALASLAFTPGAVDVSATSQTISITVRATDDSSGIQSITGSFVSPSGKQAAVFFFGNAEPVLGTPLNGVFSGTVTISPCAEPGTWTLASVIVADECGNTATYGPVAGGSTLAYPAPNGIPTQTSINVTNSDPDLAAPRVTGFSFNPASVDLTGSNRTVTVMVTGSDISSGYFGFVSPSGKESEGGGFDSINYANGVFTTAVSFNPACDPGGNWTLQYISATDGCGNSVYYDSGQLPANATVISVTNPGADTTAPQLASLALSATTADVTYGESVVSGAAVATDNAGGVQDGAGYYASADGKRTISMNFSVSGSTPALSGTYDVVMTVNACDEAGVYTLKSFTVYDACGNSTQYTAANFPGPTSFLVLNGTQTTGSIETDILPASAEYAGQWNVDGGDTRFSGTVAPGLTPGPHTVNFVVAPGYTAPASQVVDVLANQTTYVAGTYVSQLPTGSLQVTLDPAQSAGAGGLWNVDDGTLQVSGSTVTGLTNGTHTIQFTDVSGFTTPAPQSVTTVSGSTTVTTGTYTAITATGSVSVALLPPEVGGHWNVDGGPSQNSGATVNDIAPGNHFVNFTQVNGYTAPLSEAVAVNANALTSTNGVYTLLASATGSLTVNITPAAAIKAGATWNLDGTGSYKSGTTLTGLSGSGHIVSFTMVDGDITPGSQPVQIVPNGTEVITGNYIKAPGFTGAAESFVGISPSGYALLTLTMGDTGKFTGKLVTTTPSTYSLSGSFNASGYFAGQTGKPPVPYVLMVTGSTPSTYILTGSAQGKEITALPDAYSKGQTAAELGKYTVLFTGADPGAGIPQGAGYGTLTISKAGAGSIAGKLADGTSYSASSVLVSASGSHELIIFDPNIYGKKGLLSGIFDFGVPSAGKLDGAFVWEKPMVAKGPYYAAGFVTSLDATGSSFTKGMPLPFTTGTLTFSGGGLARTGTDSFTVTGNGVVTIGKPNKLSISTSTGAVSGAFEPAGAAKAISFSGLLLQDGADTRAAGYFLGPVVNGVGLSGNVTLP